jgi:alpha-tubulin suppressor-like RCC1 family protein
MSKRPLQGYAREVIEVVQDCDGATVRALLYRGTPANPAFWPRALRDLPFAAAVIGAATGPSGENIEYLNRLDEFLDQHNEASSSSSRPSLTTMDETLLLSTMAKTFKDYAVHFLFGCGSNQHNQLMLHSARNSANLSVKGEDAHEMKEIVLFAAPRKPGEDSDLPASSRINDDNDDPIVDIFAGGGHTGALTRRGRLLLWGWNHVGQLGSSRLETQTLEAGGGEGTTMSCSWPVLSEISKYRVSMAAFGFAHTLFIESDTGRLFCFGDNSCGQVTGFPEKTIVSEPKPWSRGVKDDRVIAIAAGVFHSAVITSAGELMMFGSSQSRLSLPPVSGKVDMNIKKFRLADLTPFTCVACGRGHTAVLDDEGRVWTCGDNKYGQLGRTAGRRRDDEIGHVQLDPDLECFDVKCGWSHTVALAEDSSGSIQAWGWGRNDKGQLGTRSRDHVTRPIRLFHGLMGIQSIDCGSESTVVVDDQGVIWGCGWNEHGNLGTGNTRDCLELTPIAGAPITTTPGYPMEKTKLVAVAGGAHVVAMRVVSTEE